MVSSISSGGSWAQAQVQEQARSAAADKILKAADTNNDGKITQDELTKSLDAQSNNQGTSVAELFKQLDQGSKGYITKQDLEDGMAKAEQAQKAQAQAKGPAAGGGREGGGGGGGSSSVTSFDVEDLNQDGRVTAQEKAEYAAKVYQAKKEAESAATAAVYA